MSARVPHLLTHLLSSAELDQVEAEMFERADAATGTPAFSTWIAAIELIRTHRTASFKRRAAQTPSARRKSLSYQPTASS